VNWPGGRLPGTGRTSATGLECLCGRGAEPFGPRGGICSEHDVFLIGYCVDCDGFAYSYQRMEWECAREHRFSSPLCPGCWNYADWTDSWYMCPESHEFEVHRDPCPRCRFGLLVKLIGDRTGVCEACERTRLWR